MVCTSKDTHKVVQTMLGMRCLPSFEGLYLYHFFCTFLVPSWATSMLFQPTWASWPPLRLCHHPLDFATTYLTWLSQYKWAGPYLLTKPFPCATCGVQPLPIFSPFSSPPIIYLIKTIYNAVITTSNSILQQQSTLIHQSTWSSLDHTRPSAQSPKAWMHEYLHPLEMVPYDVCHIHILRKRT